MYDRFTISIAVSILLIFMFITWCTEEVYAEEERDPIMDVVIELQPRFASEPMVAASWAAAFWFAGLESNIDPILLAVIAFRESSFQADVVGSRGEQGAMQLHGVALSHMPEGCEPTDVGCNIRGGAAVLNYWRERCHSSRWSVWVGAYGIGECPTHEEAELMPSVRVARSLYAHVGGEGWR